MRSMIKKYIPRSLLERALPAYHFVVAFLAAVRYGFPSRRLVVIGVTGTKGKTTVVHLAHEILRASGARVASLSSVRFSIGERERINDTKMTMPGRFFVSRFLRDAASGGCRTVVLEVTSQGIAQSRHRFIRFSAAVMTNVAPEHIESHGNFEKYIRAKLDLFWRLGAHATAIINGDDPAAERFAASTRAHPAWYSHHGIVIHGKTWLVANVVIGDGGISFDLEDQAFMSPLRGEFNFYNILAATAIGLSRRIPPARIADAVRAFGGVPGRMEYVLREPVAAVVDYAHTPDSLRAVYTALAGEKRRLICVLGAAGGGRDRWKRPEFGRIADQYCSKIFLTDEDPYDEDPESILWEIAAGLPDASRGDGRLRMIVDRRAAIAAALAAAGAGDAVVITGKGAEPWMMGPRDTRMPWDDRAVVREEWGKLN